MKKEELKYWKRKWELDDDLIYKKAGINQAGFVSSEICGNLLHVHGFVVSTHYSKSCELPVYYVKMRNGIKLIMRNNFHDWKMSVEIPESYDALPADFLPTDCLSHSMVENEGEKIASCYMEGFREEWCYDAYLSKNPPKRFSIEVPESYRLYVIIHRLKNAYPDVEFHAEDDKRTKEQIAYRNRRIAEVYPDGDDEALQQLSEELGVKPDCIQQLANRIGLKRNRIEKYSPQFVADLAVFFPTHTDKECAARFGITKPQVQGIARKHGWKKTTDHMHHVYDSNMNAVHKANKKKRD